MAQTKSLESAPEVLAIALDTAISPPLRALWVGAAGDVNVTTVGVNGTQTTQTIPGVPAGTRLDLQVVKVNTAGTSVATPTTNLKGWR